MHCDLCGLHGLGGDLGGCGAVWVGMGPEE
jgi:hypothetical protein